MSQVPGDVMQVDFYSDGRILHHCTYGSMGIAVPPVQIPPMNPPCDTESAQETQAARHKSINTSPKKEFHNRNRNVTTFSM
jgi:hypothetical protein